MNCAEAIELPMAVWYCAYEDNRRRILLRSYPPLASAVHRGKGASQWIIDIPIT
jgi:hypothetical protein